jgi:hypothetical protein
METVFLIRGNATWEGISGFLIFMGNLIHTGELPWKGNKPNLSCFPRGEYKVVMRISPKYGKVYHVTGVQGRSYILFHQGNFFGDKTRGYRTNTAGCVMVGMKKGKLDGQKAVLASRLARTKFEITMGFEPFILKVM